MTRAKAVLRILIGTFALIFGLAAFNVFIILNSVGVKILPPIKRNIAGINEQKQAPPPNFKTPLIKVDCRQDQQNKQLTTPSSNVRLLFSHLLSAFYASH